MTPRPLGARPSDVAMLVGSAGLAVTAGVGLAVSPSAAAVVAAVVLAAAAVSRVHPCAIAAASLAAPWLTRLLTSSGLAPRILDFVDIPLAVLAFALALVQRCDHAMVQGRVTRWLLRALLLCVAAMSASWLANVSEPLRFPAAAVLLLAPFLVIATFLLVPPPPGLTRRITRLIVALGLLQIILASVEFVEGARDDAVQGTLIGTGAGHHVMAAGATLALLVVLASSSSRIAKAAMIVGTAWAAVIADAKQVLYCVPVALVGFVLAPSLARYAMAKRLHARGYAIRRVAYALAAVLAMAAVAVRFTPVDTAQQFVDETTSKGGGKAALVDVVVSDITKDPLNLLVGFGPGETVSRFAFLTTPVMLKEGSPVEAIGLHPGKQTLKYHEHVRGATTGESSVLSAQSSVIGILGDYGLIGVGVFCYLVGVVIVGLLRSGHWMAPAAVGGWFMLAPLAFIFDWFEQPPFMMMLATISGIALCQGAGGTTAQGRSVTAR